MEAEQEKVSATLQKARNDLEKVQNEQAEDSRAMGKQQKNTERYMAKRQLLIGRKDECNRNIRDLGVLPEEAFEKYTRERLDRVRFRISLFVYIRSNLGMHIACQETPHRQRGSQEVRPRQQESLRTIFQLHEAARPATETTRRPREVRKIY